MLYMASAEIKSIIIIFNHELVMYRRHNARYFFAIFLGNRFIVLSFLKK